MSNPKQGMHHSDVRKRVKRIKSTPGGNKVLKERLVNSLIGQAEKANRGAGEDIKREFGSKRIPDMGIKSRGNYSVNICLKDCEYKNTETCEKCVRFDEYKKKEDK